MSRLENTKNLIGSFEHNEGLDPEKEDFRAEVNASEFGQPGNTNKLRNLFGDTAPVQRNFSVKKKSVTKQQNHVDEDDRLEDKKDDIKEKVEDKKDEIKEKVDQKKDEVKEKVQEIKQEDRTEKVKEKIEDKKQDAKKEEIKEKVAEKVEDKVKETKVEKKIGEKVDKVKEEVKEAVVEKKVEAKKEEKKQEIKEKVQEKQGTDDKKKPAAKGKRKVLIVYAHAFKESYEGSLVGAAVKCLKDAGADIQISNLFEMGFNAVASPKDFGDNVKDKEFYSYSLLAGLAKEKGKLAQDIVSEQDKVDWADLVVVVSQLQSHSFPALLKGWFDRIMTYNFAFSEGQLYEKGRLRGKKALLCLTTEALASMYTSRGIHGDLNIYLWPLLNGVLRFSGFDVLKPQVYFGAGRAEDNYREDAIASLQKRLLGVWDETPLSFVPTEKFDINNGFTLSEDSVAELQRTKKLTVGQHGGKSVTDQMANIVEPPKRLEAVRAAVKEQAKDGDKKPWYTYW